MGKTSSSVKDRYNAKAYDSLLVRMPKGTKELFAAACMKKGDSMNAVLVRAIKDYIVAAE